MKHTIIKITLAALTAAALSACDSGGGDNSEPIVNQPELPFGVDKNFGSAGYVKPDFSATHDSLNSTRSYDIASVTTDAAGRVTAIGRFKNSDRGSHFAFIARFRRGIEYFKPDLTLVVGRSPTISVEAWRWLVSSARDVQVKTYGNLLDELRLRHAERGAA